MRTILLMACMLMAAAAQASTRGTEWLSQLPLRFEPSQRPVSHGGAQYVARGANYVLSLVAAGENCLEWNDPIRGRTARVRTRLAGANRDARPEPLDRLPGSASYFLGGEESWRTGVTGYGRIRYRNVYAGIDLVFHGEQGRLEYDFLVAPHADPRAIRLELSGHRALRVDGDGSLIISTDAGEVRWKRPEIYQEYGGTRRPVAGRFVLSGRRAVAFDVGAYDRGHALVIDPTLSYSTFLGGSGNDFARGIGVDGAGNVYIAGGTSSPNLTPLSAAQPTFGGQTANLASGDAFVAKFSPAGALLYLTYLGGAGDDTGMALAVDAAGNAYITGFTTSQNFPMAGTPYQSRFGGLGGSTVLRTGDAFVAKLNPAGNRLIYSTYLGGNLDDFGLAIAVDSTGAAYITGGTTSVNFPTTTGAYQTSFRGSGGQPPTYTFGVPFVNAGDAFVAKLDPNGASLVYSTFLGGSRDDVGSTLALDSSNNVYVAGFTLSTNFPVTAGSLQQSFGGTDSQDRFFNTGDGFIAKLKPDGTGLVYSTFFGGAGDDYVQSIAVDPSGAVYFTGSSGTTNLPATAGVFQRAYSGYRTLPANVENVIGDAFVGKLNPAGSALVYLSYLGGSANDSGTAIAIDAAGNAYVAGFTDSLDFPLSQDAAQRSFGGDTGSVQLLPIGDGFLSVVNPTGTQLLYSSYFGGSRDDMVFGLALDSLGNIYLAGNTFSTNFKLTANGAQQTFGGAQQVYTFPWGDGFYAVFSGIGPSGGGALAVTSAATLPAGTPGAAYSFTLAATGGAPPYTWSLVSGALPAGLTLSTSGAITGTPTLIGSSNFTVRVTDSGSASATQALTLVITSATSGLSVTTVSPLPPGSAGAAYSQALTASGGNPPYTWSLTSGALPAGLTLSASGAITGTPTGPGSASFTVQVSDSSAATATQAFTMTILSAGSLTRSGVVAQVASGGGWKTTISLVNLSSSPVNVRVLFWAEDGSALSLPLNISQQGAVQAVTGSSLDRTLVPNTTLLIDTEAPASSAVVGWADVLSSGPVRGFAIFRQIGSNGAASEGTVPLQSQFPSTVTLPYDNTTGFVTGVAIANLSAAGAATLTTTIYDENGSLLSVQPVALPVNGHTSFALPERLGVTAGRRGIVVFQSPTTSGLAGIGLRFNGLGAFTSVPTILP